MADQDTRAWLAEARVARLATVDDRGGPHVVPIVFVYEGDEFYSPIDAKPKSVPPERLRRVRNIRRNPDVQVLIDEYDEDWSRLRYAQLRGRASLLEGGEELERAHRLLEAKYQQYRDMPLTGRPVIKVTIEDVVVWAST